MDLDAALRLLADDPAAPLDLAELALRLAGDEYPDLDVEAYLGELDGMAREARLYVRGDLEAQVTGLCRYLFHEMGFNGNTQHYYDPRNSYLNEVLDRRTGLPITLSVVAMAVGARAGLKVAGVGLPGHFVAKAVDGDQEVLFDPFHGGRRLTPEQCERLVERVTGQPVQLAPVHLRAVPTGLIVQRMLTNLKSIYLGAEDIPRALRVLERLRQLAPHDAQQRRDLGTVLLQAEEPGRAIDHLSAYLEAVPDGNDAPTVRKLLDQARSAVARWN
jgi:regulator of sirC expression with transglutaminase-like and TPR domain